jgi:hypothetical protein
MRKRSTVFSTALKLVIEQLFGTNLYIILLLTSTLGFCMIEYSDLVISYTLSFYDGLADVLSFCTAAPGRVLGWCIESWQRLVQWFAVLFA